MKKSCCTPWVKGMLLLGVAFLAAVWLVKPIGVSTQFVIFDALVWESVSPGIIEHDAPTKTGYASPNAYLNKSDGKYAKAVANPVNYSFIFVLAMMAGAFISSRLRGGQSQAENTMPPVWRTRFGGSVAARYVAVFIAGFLVLYGARLAGGCTSGHMMSGIMQTALSGYIFALGAFAAAVPTAFLLFNRKRGS